MDIAPLRLWPSACPVIVPATAVTGFDIELFREDEWTIRYVATPTPEAPSPAQRPEAQLPPSFLNWLWDGQLAYRVNDLVQYCGQLRRYADDGSELRAGWFALKYPSQTG